MRHHAVDRLKHAAEHTFQPAMAVTQGSEIRRTSQASGRWGREWLAHMAHILAALWVALNILDSWVSRHALHNGVAAEANPVYQNLGPVAADCLKAGATLTILWLIWCLWRRAPKVAVVMLGLLCSWIAFVNLWNLYWLS